ncbi:MAG: histidine phosphatase family protein [Bacilli bacterium]|nr:histidine phosphatase family protein [Bacilli bacterium]
MERAKQFINKIKNNYPNKNILIVSHAGLIKALHFNLIGYGENTDFLSFVPKNTTIYEYILK